jgi:hypothetical protein
MRQLSMATRRELKDAIRERYQAVTKRRERRQVLAEFRCGSFRRIYRRPALRLAPAEPLGDLFLQQILNP